MPNSIPHRVTRSIPHRVMCSRALPVSMAFALMLAAACGRGYVVDQAEVFYTQVNLRANSRGQMTSVQQWRGTEVIPLCTPVRMTSVRSREIRFSEEQSGRELRYILHRSTRLPVEDHVQRMFGPTCPTMEAENAEGIHLAQPVVGMTRSGVLMAVGYPPEHRTPNLTDAEWTYWGTAGNVVVHFEGERVAFVDDPASTSAVAPPAAAAAPAVANAPGFAPAQPAPAAAAAAAPPPPATQQVAVQPRREGRRARRRRRLRAAGVGAQVVVNVAASHAPPPQAQPAQAEPAPSQGGTRRTQPSGCQSMTINGTTYTDHHGTAFMQDCTPQSGCPDTYVCVLPGGSSGWCMPNDGQRCRD